MRERIVNEVVVAVSFALLLLLMTNPWYFWMPDTLVYASVAILFVLAGIFAGVAFRGAPQDEREEAHLFFASRVAYFSGVIVLLLGVSYQAVTSAVDPWLASVLAVMVIGRALGHAWAKRYK